MPGVISVGDTRDDAHQLIQEAIEFHIEGLRAEGLDVPMPASIAAEVEVAPVA